MKAIDQHPPEVHTSSLAGGGQQSSTDGTINLAIYMAATLSGLAAMIHLWMMPDHFQGWWGYGAYCLAVALAQGLYGVVLLRWPGPLVFLLGVAGNLAVILVNVATYTSGVTFGPHAGKLENAGTLDVTATVVELGIIVALVAMLGGRSRRVTVNALLLLGVAMWGTRLLGIFP